MTSRQHNWDHERQRYEKNLSDELALKNVWKWKRPVTTDMIPTYGNEREMKTLLVIGTTTQMSVYYLTKYEIPVISGCR